MSSLSGPPVLWRCGCQLAAQPIRGQHSGQIVACQNAKIYWVYNSRFSPLKIGVDTSQKDTSRISATSRSVRGSPAPPPSISARATHRTTFRLPRGDRG